MNSILPKTELFRAREEGFTLIELLVVIVTIGILSAVALPSYLNQAGKARSSEARSHLATVNRSQQAYRLEQRTFANDLDQLDVRFQGSFYSYQITGAVTASFVATTATTRQDNLKGYSSAASQSGDNFNQVICETVNVVSTGTSAAAPSISANPVCGTTEGLSDLELD